MTEALKPLLASLHHTHLTVTYLTAPLDGPYPLRSIDHPSDCALSTTHIFPTLQPHLANHDAFLVACYSSHPLVPRIRQQLGKGQHVTGIFEASVATSLDLLAQREVGAFGIVTTGKVWEEALGRGVEAMGVAGGGGERRFAGVESTGLSAYELHALDAAEVRKAISATTRKLLGRRPDVRVVCLGCAGMAGMEQAVREGCVDALGEAEGERVIIVDGVLAGVNMLAGYLKAGL
ncbi:Asp/Glu/hydantoin racemase [Cladochytrium replicatum]|nr:Asp/Glu/hydantoin racemase [Cladochytrium replicatum]